MTTSMCKVVCDITLVTLCFMPDTELQLGTKLIFFYFSSFSVLSGTTFDLPDTLSDGRFLLPQKMSSDKMCMFGSDFCENNFCPPDKL